MTPPLGPVGPAAGELVATTGATPAPDAPELREGLDPLDVSPGVLGFLVIFAVVLACIPLFRSMTSKLRGVEYRARREEEAAASRGEEEEEDDDLGPYRGDGQDDGAPRQ